MNEEKRNHRNLLLFPIASIGRDMAYVLFTNFLLTYVLFTRRLDAAQLTAITLIMVGARIFDGLNDPIMGNIVECTRSRYGKFKPWLVLGILSTSAVIIVTFNTSLQGWSFIALFGVMYFLYSIAYTMHDISYWGMIASLGSDANARNQFTSRATLFAGIGSTLAAMLIPMFTTGSMALGGSASKAYGIIAVAIGIIAPILMAVTVFGVKENRTSSEYTSQENRVSLKHIVSVIKGNDQLMWIAVAFVIQQVGNQLAQGGLASTYVYLDYGYSGGLYSIFNTVGMVATAFMMIFYPMITRKITRKQLMGILLGVSATGYGATLVSGLLIPDAGIRFWAVTIANMLANFGQYGFYLIMMISIINTVEYNQYLHGTRQEGIIASLRPFLTKLASALVVVMTTVSYMIFRVTDCTNVISEMENAASAGTITEVQKLASIETALSSVGSWQITGLMIVMTVIPFVLMVISWWIYRKHYRLNETEYERICSVIAQRQEG